MKNQCTMSGPGGGFEPTVRVHPCFGEEAGPEMGSGASQNEGTNPFFVDSIGVVDWLWLAMRVSPGVTRYRAEGPVWRELAREGGLASAERGRGPGGTVVPHVSRDGRRIVCVFEVHLFVLVAGKKRKVVTHLWVRLTRCVTSASGGFCP